MMRRKRAMCRRNVRKRRKGEEGEEHEEHEGGEEAEHDDEEEGGEGKSAGHFAGEARCLTKQNIQ